MCLETGRCSWVALGNHCPERYVYKDDEALVSVSVCHDRWVLSVMGPEEVNCNIYIMNLLSIVLQKCKLEQFLSLRPWICSDEVNLPRQWPLWAGATGLRFQRLKLVSSTQAAPQATKLLSSALQDRLTLARDSLLSKARGQRVGHYPWQPGSHRLLSLENRGPENGEMRRQLNMLG